MKDEKINISDYSVGDYIHIKDFDKEVPYQILSINRSDIDTNVLKELEFDSIEPIPITPEILDENNFHYLEDGHFYYDLTVDLHPMEFGKYGPYRIGKMPIFINYVHELQHIMRLYNKEIKL